MSALEQAAPAQPRLRLLALALAAWNDHLPIPGARPTGESGREHSAWSGQISPRERDRLLLKLSTPNDRDDHLAGEPDDRNVIGLEQYQRSHAGRFWQELDAGMTLLQQYDPRGHRLIVDVLINPLDADLDVVARLHALAYVAGGIDHAVEAPRYVLVRALLHLSKLIPDDLQFPPQLHDQVALWQDWLTTMRSVPSKTDPKRKTRPDVSAQAMRRRNVYVRELYELAGWSQSRIAKELGLNQSTVSRIIGNEKGAP